MSIRGLDGKHSRFERLVLLWRVLAWTVSFRARISARIECQTPPVGFTGRCDPSQWQPPFVAANPA